jgi:hypothetical protein
MQCGNAQMSPHNCTALPTVPRPTAPESVRMRTNGILTAQIASHGPTQAAKLSGCTMTDVVDVGTFERVSLVERAIVYGYIYIHMPHPCASRVKPHA